MEEDIKILEKWLENLNRLFNETHINNTKERHALENLIKGYREIKEENRIFALVGSNIALKLHIEKNYISKSKIKEKIEELKEIKRVQENNPFTSPVYIKELEYGIQILEELLEGE